MMKMNRRLTDEYSFPGCRPQLIIKGKICDPNARIITMIRAQKKRCADVAALHAGVIMTSKQDGYETYHAETQGYTLKLTSGGLTARYVAK